MEFVSTILNQINFPLVGYAIGMVYVAILVPTAIKLFSDKKEFEILDRNVLLDHVVRAKSLLLFLGMIFIPPIFWDILSWPTTRLIEIAVWGTGIYFMTMVLKKSYRWMKTDKLDLRYNYLKDLKDKNDLRESWHSYWKVKDSNQTREEHLLYLFTSQMEEKLKKEWKSQISKHTVNLLQDFDSLLEKRHPLNLIIGDIIFPKILSWHFKAWKVQKKALESTFNTIWYEMSYTLEEIVRKIELITLKSRLFFNLLRHLAHYAENNKEEAEFVRNLFSSFFYEFSENASEIPDRKNVWHHLPTQWRITESNLRSKQNNVYAYAWWEIYVNWALPRIFEAKIEYDKFLDEASTALFPEVDPTIWAKLQIFSFLPGDSVERVNYAISHAWTFGHWSILPSFIAGKDISDLEAKESSRKARTFSLAGILFRDRYVPDKLQEYISILDDIDTGDNTSKDSKRKILLGIFKDMLEYLGEEDVE